MDTSYWFLYKVSSQAWPRLLSTDLRYTVSPNIRDFASLGLWPFPDAIFYLFVGELVENNWGELVGFSLVKDVDLIQCNLKSVSVFSYYYFWEWKHIESTMLCYSLAKHATFCDPGIMTFSRRHASFLWRRTSRKQLRETGRVLVS